MTAVKLSVAVILTTSLTSLAAIAQGGQHLVVGYYPDWSRGTYPASAIAYQNLTHIAHAFLFPNADGSLGGTSGFSYPDLIQQAHHSGVKVVVSLGGWGQSGGFSPMAADTAARRRFVQNVRSFCVTEGYDGVDLDWEYPASAADRSNLTLLVRELREAFTGVPLSISMAVPAGDWTGKWFDFATMVNDIDWLGIMTYDFYGSWNSTSGPNSPLYGHWSLNTQGWIDDSYAYYRVTRALPSSKILIGIPFYGWAFNAASMYGSSSGASQMAYKAIAPLLSQGWTRYWDSEGGIPYVINATASQVISYDDTASIRAKCDYILTKGIRGTIIWAIGQDYQNAQQPLLAFLGVSLGLVSGVPSSEAPPFPASSALLQNYPNPFNPSTVITVNVARKASVKLIVYTATGQEVVTLMDGEYAGGRYQVPWNGKDNFGGQVASGVYFCRLTTGEYSATTLMLLMR